MTLAHVLERVLPVGSHLLWLLALELLVLLVEELHLPLWRYGPLHHQHIYPERLLTFHRDLLLVSVVLPHLVSLASLELLASLVAVVVCSPFLAIPADYLTISKLPLQVSLETSPLPLLASPETLSSLLPASTLAALLLLDSTPLLEDKLCRRRISGFTG